MIKKLKVNDEFKSKTECFEIFKDLIKKEAFDLIDDNIMKWRRQEIEEFYLNETEIKKLIEKINVNDMRLYKDSRFVIEKFDHDRIEQYFDDKEKLKEI